ncbi:chemotaxis protein CheW [Crocosphaera watsonii WH 8501]|uniref:CheW-like protein n=4 Tax=Crocosphaera watsonii TaxID=263511 RepID=Q4BZD8_CROWT|nr:MULTISPECIES: chemotaxis protein CheW [Crocosphaera]EAM49275.1 CheW-like protein [Crocosphaera watsonii WH 8501]EHJ11131.1 CheW protein [Crocosphaera watsonii WH 0003]MCH2246203.1 chemotaxis protein CheW [Crocosphaera sp.]NQZ63840.1 chemotaxis protein CheW [Crocosphaera sp.]CCQ53959.1 Positive regulator of CheA protein activity (CheW) [Crocosphaera watsonii WH 0005]
MTISSSRLARRLASKKQEKKQQLITFLLGKEQFSIPIDFVDKVTTLDKVYGDPQQKGVSLTNYQGRELIVIDVAQRIFGVTDIGNNQPNNEVRFLLILKNRDNDILGLPIDSHPSIIRVPKSAFIPLPDIYLTQGNIHCISSTIIKVENQSPYFVLDINQLL